jgi:hypothetical protein
MATGSTGIFGHGVGRRINCSSFFVNHPHIDDYRRNCNPDEYDYINNLLQTPNNTDCLDQVLTDKREHLRESRRQCSIEFQGVIGSAQAYDPTLLSGYSGYDTYDPTRFAGRAWIDYRDPRYTGFQLFQKRIDITRLNRVWPWADWNCVLQSLYNMGCMTYNNAIALHKLQGVRARVPGGQLTPELIHHLASSEAAHHATLESMGSLHGAAFDLEQIISYLYHSENRRDVAITHEFACPTIPTLAELETGLIATLQEGNITMVGYIGPGSRHFINILKENGQLFVIDRQASRGLGSRIDFHAYFAARPPMQSFHLVVTLSHSPSRLKYSRKVKKSPLRRRKSPLRRRKSPLRRRKSPLRRRKSPLRRRK